LNRDADLQSAAVRLFLRVAEWCLRAHHSVVGSAASVASTSDA
jgi:hypothetical protein